MLVIKIELWPGGHESKARVIGKAVIVNQAVATLLSDGAVGDYRCELRGGTATGNPDYLWKTARLKNFDRRRGGVWDMLYLLLHKAVGARNRGLRDAEEK